MSEMLSHIGHHDRLQLKDAYGCSHSQGQLELPKHLHGLTGLGRLPAHGRT